MMIDGVATLIAETYTQNEIGQFVLSGEAETEIFVSEKGVTRAEFFSAGKQGVSPEVVLVTPRVNYDGQKSVDYRGKRYSIYRSYFTDENVELYLAEKVGNGNQPTGSD